MLGRSHAQVAGITWVGVLTVGARYGVPVDGVGFALSTCAAVGAGLFPDVDHPGSSTTRNLGIVGTFMSRIVRRLCRGHRGLTHTLGAVGAAMAVTLVAEVHPWSLAVLLGLLVATALDIMPKVPEGWEWAAAALVAAGSASIGDTLPWWLLPAAVGWGWHAHLICDRCTVEKIPYAWPFTPGRVAWGLFKTGSVAEHWTVRAVWVAVLLVVVRVGPFTG